MIVKNCLFILCVGIVGAAPNLYATSSAATTNEVDEKNNAGVVQLGAMGSLTLEELRTRPLTDIQNTLYRIIVHNKGTVLARALAILNSQPYMHIPQNLASAYSGWMSVCRERRETLENIRDFATSPFAAVLCAQVEPTQEDSPLSILALKDTHHTDQLIFETLNALVAAGTRVNKSKRDDNTTIHQFAMRLSASADQGTPKTAWVAGLLAHGADIAMKNSTGQTPYEMVIDLLSRCDNQTPNGYRSSILLKNLKLRFDTHVQTLCHEFFGVLTSPALTLAQHAPRTETKNPILDVFSEYVGLVKPKNQAAAATATTA